MREPERTSPPASAIVSAATSALRAARPFVERYFTRRVVRWLALAATVGMFLVLVMGITVTNTGSAEGCGRDWPLCHGRFIPEFAVSTAIEFTHRAVTGIEGLLVVALTAGVLLYWRARREIRILAPVMVIFLVLQAGLGALAVKYPTSPEVLASHFGISLISFASILLTAAFLYQEATYDRLRDRPVPTGFRRLAWGMTIYTYLVVYTGAYVRHRGVELACRDWPLCNGQLVPSLVGGTGIVFTHRVAALLLTGGAVWIFAWGRRLRGGRPDLYWGGVAALAGVLLQALEGALVVSSRLNLFSLLAHGAIIALLFGALCYLVFQVTPRPRGLRSLVKPRPAERTSAGVAPTAQP